MTQYSWNTQADWDAAQSRSRVVTRNVGVRVPDHIWQGFDPVYAPYDTLTSYWTLDETSGSTAYDSAGTDNGTINGPALGSQGILSSNAYDFDGADDYVATSFNPPNDGIASTSFWVNFDSVSGDQLCGLNDSNYSDPRFYLGLWNGDVIGGFGSNASTYATSLSTGTWYHFAMTGDGSTARVYLNGSEVTSFSYTFDQADIGYYIGARNYPDGPSRHVDGQISDVKVWTRELSASEVQTIYDTGASGSLTTSTVQDDGEAVEIETSATIPTSTAADLTVYQDTTGDGTADYSETISVASGTNTTALSSFRSATGATYWVGLSSSTTDITATPRFSSAVLTTEKTTIPATVTYSVGLTRTGAVSGDYITGTITQSQSLTKTASVGTSLSEPGSITQTTSRTLTAGEPVVAPAETTTTGSFTLESVPTGLTGEEHTITDYVSQGDILDPVLAELDDDDTTILFPAGSYKLGSFTSKADNLELVAPDGNVTIDPIGEEPTLLQFSGDGWRIHGFEFDFRTATPKQIRAAGSGWSIVDCVWRGAMDWPSSHPSQTIAAQVDYARGEGRIRGCYFPDGAGTTGYGTAIRETGDSIGKLQVQYSWFEDWVDAAIDLQDGFGPAVISQCYVRNTTGGIRVNGPIQLMSSTFVCDGVTPIAASGHETMECWLAGDRRTDRDTVYIEDCDFAWLSEGAASAGHPIDNTTGVEHLQMFDCRLHNETSEETLAVGGGSVDVHLTEESGTARTLQQTGGFFGTKQIRGGSGVVADPSPPIPDPPVLGETPSSPEAGDVKVGRPGGSSGRFYGI